ncbi:hypothetical protein [Kribbella sp. NBC_00359]|uniref:hypothetical protein n=1 Tax=Kribbella sp. NBC_00359 TaxID=2975966 RepID=UPI002E1D94F2
MSRTRKQLAFGANRDYGSYRNRALAAQVGRTMSIVGRNRTVIWCDTQVARTAQPTAV